MTKTKIATHYDPDGIASVILYMKANGLTFEDVEVYFPSEFGGYKSDTKFMFDMTPKDGFDGMCFDHHNQHQQDKEYMLIYDTVPTTRIIYDNFEVPDEERWKAVVGIMGDYSPESIPVEIWEDFPSLRDYHASTWQDWDVDGGVDVSSYPLYKLLSSPINAPCRVGYPDEALKKLFEAESPLDILYDKDLIDYKTSVNNATKRAIRKIGKDGNYKVMVLGRKDIVLITFSAKTRLSGILASKYYEHFKDGETKSVIALNLYKSRNKGSIRGPLTPYLNYKLNGLGYHVGGHDVAAGINLNGKAIDELINDLTLI